MTLREHFPGEQILTMVLRVSIKSHHGAPYGKSSWSGYICKVLSHLSLLLHLSTYTHQSNSRLRYQHTIHIVYQLQLQLFETQKRIYIHTTTNTTSTTSLHQSHHQSHHQPRVFTKLTNLNNQPIKQHALQSVCRERLISNKQPCLSPPCTKQEGQRHPSTQQPTNQSSTYPTSSHASAQAATQQEH